MGFYTELIFNNIDVSAESILPLRDSARDVLCQKDCPWAYMLNYIYAESSENEIIDLQISKAMTQHLAESYRTPVTLEQYAETHLSNNDANIDDLPWFILE